MKRFLSLIMALTLVVSLFTVNVMAASKAHTVTITADKTTDLKAGDTVTVEVVMDNTANLVSCGYELFYDQTAFTADTSEVSREAAYIDATWLKGIKADDDWAYYLNAPTFAPQKKAAETGSINFKWAGSGAIEADYAVDNKVIGKFYLTVKDGAPNGEYEFELIGKTGDGGENSTADIVCAPVTVTVGEGKQEATPEFDGATGNVTEAGKIGVEGTKEDGTKVTYDNAYSVSVTIDNLPNADSAGVKFIPTAVLNSNQGSWATAAKAVFNTTGLGKGENGFTAALINIPAQFREEGIEIKAHAFMVVDGVEIDDTNIITKTIKWDITPDRD